MGSEEELDSPGLGTLFRVGLLTKVLLLLPELMGIRAGGEREPPCLSSLPTPGLWKSGLHGLYL